MLIYITSFTVCSGNIKKKEAYFQSFPPPPPDPKSEKNFS